MRLANSGTSSNIRSTPSSISTSPRNPWRKARNSETRSNRQTAESGRPLEIQAREHDSAGIVLLPYGAELGQIRAEVPRRRLVCLDVVHIAAHRIRLHRLVCR